MMDLAEQVNRAGYKLTPPRQAVLQVLAESNGHLTHAQVWERGLALHPALGRATVYRTLELLTSLGIVRPLYLGDQSVCFCRADGAHHHLICSDCGAVVEFEECVIDGLQQNLSERFDFQIRGHLLEFYGLCSRCHERNVTAEEVAA